MKRRLHLAGFSCCVPNRPDIRANLRALFDLERASMQNIKHDLILGSLAHRLHHVVNVGSSARERRRVAQCYCISVSCLLGLDQLIEKVELICVGSMARNGT